MTAPTAPDGWRPRTCRRHRRRPRRRLAADRPAPPSPADAGDGAGRARSAAQVSCAGSLALGAALVIFGAFLLAKGANPIEVYQTMWESIAGDTNSFGELLVQAAPFMLAAPRRGRAGPRRAVQHRRRGPAGASAASAPSASSSCSATAARRCRAAGR